MSRLTGFSPIVRKLIKERAGTHDYLVRCERCGVWREDIQLHHRLPRGRGGTRKPSTNQAANGLALCQTCHHFVESYRNDALELGLLISQFDRRPPTEIPVQLDGGLYYLLADDGEKYAVPNPHRETA
jgi:5-methylcytosine-specific restriction protein A